MVTDLHIERLETVVRQLRLSGARSVLDLGCGPGELLLRLAREPRFQRLVGIDISPDALAIARRRLGLGYADDPRITLLQASFAQADERLTGFDAAVLLETVEHINPHRLSAVESAVLSHYRPRIIIITTPNQEYNVLHGLPHGVFRHPDHRFEWSRARFRAWARGIARRNDYTVTFGNIGEIHPLLGSSTQMATFSRLSGADPRPASR
jgi:small RNA 2'-O-methyltransferase